MTTPRQPDPVRSAGIRSMLISTVDASEAKKPVRRAILFTSLATTAVLVIGGVGITISRLNEAPTPGPGLVAPTNDPTSPYSDIPLPTGTPTNGSGVVEGAGTPSPTPLAPDPTPSPTVDLTDPGSWKITFDGIGPISVGIDQATQESALSVFAVGDDGTGNFCGIKSWSGPDETSMALTKDETGPNLGSVQVSINVPEYMKTVATPAQYAAMPKTESGIGLGSSLASVKAAYPSLQQLGIGVQGTDYQVTDSRGHLLVFDIGAEDKVVSINAAESRTQFGASQTCG